jgi:hypothetical protein
MKRKLTGRTFSPRQVKTREYPSADPGAEGERPSFAGDDRIANDVDVPGEPSLDLP